jgi:hypothetical protein
LFGVSPDHEKPEETAQQKLFGETSWKNSKRKHSRRIERFLDQNLEAQSTNICRVQTMSGFSIFFTKKT